MTNLENATALDLINRVDDRTGASVRMYADVDAAPIAWAEHIQPTAHRYLDRAPVVGDIITVTPLGERLFDVVALDEVYGEFIYAAPAER